MVIWLLSYKKGPTSTTPRPRTRWQELGTAKATACLAHAIARAESTTTEGLRLKAANKRINQEAGKTSADMATSLGRITASIGDKFN